MPDAPDDSGFEHQATVQMTMPELEKKIAQAAREKESGLNDAKTRVASIPSDVLSGRSDTEQIDIEPTQIAGIFPGLNQTNNGKDNGTYHHDWRKND